MQAYQQPIPARFYNEAYFTGVTSNYANGYEWDTMGPLFISTARLLMWMFPAATTYLDFGAAKGFLVKALREAGKDAWGIEHSPYCLETAEAEAKPYLAPDVRAFWALPQGHCDVVTAFETLEHLTVPQITEVLSVLRRFAGQALFATIPCVDMQARWARDLADKDPTHLTIVERRWWHEQFEAAGFVHDQWQCLVERFLSSHPLVQQAGWNIFVLGV